jgi:hypothetical protein
VEQPFNASRHASFAASGLLYSRVVAGSIRTALILNDAIRA